MTKCEACDRPARYCGETHPYTSPAAPALDDGLEKEGYPHSWREDSTGNCAECGNRLGFWAHQDKDLERLIQAIRDYVAKQRAT